MSSSGEPTTSVLIAAHGRPELLRQTLQSLATTDQATEIAQVTIVENAATPELAGIVDEFRDALPLGYHYSEHANKSAALNLGLQQAKDGLIILLDADVRVGKALISAYLEAAVSTGAGAFFGGPLGVEHEESPDAALLPYMTASTKGWALADEDQWVSKRTRFLGCNWAAYRSDLLAIGGFDPEFGPGSPSGATGQESNAQRRLTRSGLRGRYVARAHVSHHVSADQMTTDWILVRRRRSGQELGRIIAGRFPKLARRAALRAALALLRMGFRRRNPRIARLKTFDESWWAAYAEGAESAL